jgi:hypothetical protein
MTREAACTYLSVGIVTFKNRYHPKLKHVKVGKNFMYLSDEIKQLVKAQFESNDEDLSVASPVAKKPLKPRATVGLLEFEKAARAAQRK